MRKYFCLTFLLLFSYQLKAEKTIDNVYSQEIFESGYISFIDKDFKNLTVIKELKNLNTENKFLFIYTPGSLNDDRKDIICSTYNEFAYLNEIFFQINQINKSYFYLNCTNLIEGDMLIPNGSNFPYIYQGDSKHEKIRTELLKLIDNFNKLGFNNEKIFLVGHSCGAWHSLLLGSLHPDKINSVIAFSPSCYGPRYLYFQRRAFLKYRQNDKNTMRKNKYLSSLVFVSPNDPRENYLTLKWLKRIKGLKLIKTMERKNNFYYLNDQICKFHSELDVKEEPIFDGHNLHFSKCFDYYSEDIIEFLKAKFN
ncbi:MAG: hypothetical protein CFH19_01040 [Alphaproteobacteria bacterium MarineAlpha5_Bin9]|nr:MAG: hypothetical protein CFH19_01040 [Alphaproteobacteria bacterium MarineAlpha5_Bin9]